MTPQKIIIFVILITLVVGGIIYLNSQKAPRDTIGGKVDVKTADKEEKAKRYEPAKEITTPDGFINTDGKPITIGEFIANKVVLVDFWTYSCINCQRTTPYLNAWYEKYKDKGLVIIGLHTPEFEFEKVYQNVIDATKRLGIKYPVVLDNDYSTWNAYQNRFWPRKYLIDIDGFIVYDHIGEGAYAETEQKIQELLEERNRILNLNAIINKTISKPSTPNQEFGKIGTPEIYFGYEFSRNQMGNKEGWQPDTTVIYKKPETLSKNLFYLYGNWKNNKDNMELVGNGGTITLNFFAKEVHFVAGASQPTEITIYIDGEQKKTLTVKDFDLYTVASLPDYSEHTLEIKSNSGLMAYTFTFG